MSERGSIERLSRCPTQGDTPSVRFPDANDFANADEWSNIPTNRNSAQLLRPHDDNRKALDSNGGAVSLADERIGAMSANRFRPTARHPLAGIDGETEERARTPIDYLPLQGPTWTGRKQSRESTFVFRSRLTKTMQPRQMPDS
jgi:hypothetical protein